MSRKITILAILAALLMLAVVAVPVAATGWCSSDSQCDDGKPCTNDYCQWGFCYHVDYTNLGSCVNDCQSGGGVGCQQTCKACSWYIDECNHDSDCNDGNLCTTDTCNQVQGPDHCVYTPNTDSCNDGDACTQIDTCSGGVCVGGNPVVCTASDQCHDAGTCNTGTGICSNPSKENGASCSDGFFCNGLETCSLGVCLDGADPVCDDQNACTGVETCNEETDGCTNPMDVVCDARECYDAGVCNPGDGICNYVPSESGTPCDGVGMCNGQGLCVECNVNENCAPYQSCEIGICTDKQYGCGLDLNAKDPGTWQIVPGGASGTMGFDASSFLLTGSGLQENTKYNLVYYPDPWPGTGLEVISTFTTNGSGAIPDTGGGFDFTSIPIAGDANPGAKVWVVLSSDVGSGQMTGWNPTAYLFESNLINTDGKTNLCGGQPAPECYDDGGCNEGFVCSEVNTCVCPEEYHDYLGKCIPDTSCENVQCGENEVCVDGGCQPISNCADSILGEYTWNYFGYTHDMILDEYNSGTGHVGGHGTFTGGVEPADGTKWVLNGTLYDDAFTFTVVYTEGPRAGAGCGSGNCDADHTYRLTTTGNTENCALITGDGWTIIRVVPSEQVSSYPVCYSRGLKEYAYICEQALTSTPTQELRLSPGGAKLLFKVERAGGSMDAFIVWDPTAGEQSFAPLCNGLEWYNDRCTELRTCGFTPLTIEVNNPHGKIRMLGVMDESTTPGAPPATYTIMNQYTGKVYFSITTSDEVFDKTFVVVDDYTGCVIRPQLVGVWGDWIPALPPTPTP